MKNFLFWSLIFTCFSAVAGRNDGNEWQETSLPDSAIEHIQKAKFQYGQCIRAEINKVMDSKMDSRRATDLVMKQCENELTRVRKIFIDEKVPEHIADRYMKQTRTQTARNTLKQLMYVDAAKKMGAPIQ